MHQPAKGLIVRHARGVWRVRFGVLVSNVGGHFGAISSLMRFASLAHCIVQALSRLSQDSVARNAHALRRFPCAYVALSAGKEAFGNNLFAVHPFYDPKQGT